MDAVYFLKERTRIIRFYYSTSITTFGEIKRKIEVQESPFDDPPYSESGEPAYLNQWIDADVALDLLGLAAISLLSDSLKLYLIALQRRVIGFEFSESKKKLFQSGFVRAYKLILGDILQTDWSDCSVDFNVIEQVVLARNQGQHGGDLTSFHVSHDTKTLEKHPRPFFASKEECETWSQNGGDPTSFFGPTLRVTSDRLFSAIAEVERLADWIESRMAKVYDWRMGRS